MFDFSQDTHTRVMKISLSLGSGGARGFAHMGVIEELEARGHEIVAVAGASMGALVGGVYAAGKLPEFHEWSRALTQGAVLRLLDPVLLGPGIIKADRVVGEISAMLGDARIEDLAIPYTAVAADLTAKREVWFQTGPIRMAIRASIAIPSVITPVNYGGHILVDGGIMNPVPLEPLSSVVADATIAVALSGRPTSVGTLTAMVSDVGGKESVDWTERFWRSATEIMDNDLMRGLVGRFAHKPKLDGETAADGENVSFDSLPDSLKTADVITMSLDSMQSKIERYRMAANPPDLLISIPADVSGTYDFHRATDIAAVGRERAIEALDRAGL